MQTGLIALTILLLVMVSTAYVAVRLQQQASIMRRKRTMAEQRLALELSPAYQSKIQADRAYALQQERQTQELALKWQEHDLKRAEFGLQEYLARHRIPEQSYSINETITTLTAFPSLKPASPSLATQAGVSSLGIPNAYDLLDVFRTEEITPDRIFLGKCLRDAQELSLFVKASQLHHAAFSASTGYGKTTLIRGIIPQLLSIGHQVILADLKYTDVTEKGDDWRPIAARLYAQEPLPLATGYTLPNILRREEQIAALLHWLAYPELQQRLDMRMRRDYSYPTLDVFLEELVALTVAYPGVTKDILRIISLGRELRLNLFTTAQNMQVSSVGLSGGAREQFTTAWFLGGDEISAAALLDMTRKELSDFLHGNNIVLGQGVGMMRNNYILPTAGLVRLGYSSNDSIYHLLGKADDFELTRAEELAAKHRSYSVPQDSTREPTARLNRSTREEPDTEPLETVPMLESSGTFAADCNPFVLFSEEQRTAILSAAKQPGMSLKKIRNQAHIGNDKQRWAALKLWLSMHGYAVPTTTHQEVSA